MFLALVKRIVRILIYLDRRVWKLAIQKLKITSLLFFQTDTFTSTIMINSY